MPRAGFVAIAGRPNVGKSTLVNRLVKSKVAITSDKPQTTRRAIRGIVRGSHDGDPYELVLVDLPGVQRPRDLLTERMQHRVERQLADCDAALMIINGADQVGPGDRFIARALIAAGKPVLAAVNKIDVIDKAEIVEALFSTARLEDAGLALHGVFPISALRGDGLDTLLEALVTTLPEGPPHYPEAAVSDEPVERHLAELIREQALVRTREELPHAIEVQIDSVERKDDLVVVSATLLVETDSQKAIVVGRHGSMVKAIGTAARVELQDALASRVHLDLKVKVRRSWRGDESLLNRLGIEG